MIIFNAKGLLVGIAAVIVLLGLSLLSVNFGYSLAAAGIIGFYCSMKLSPKGEGYLSKPSFFFIPTHVYSAAIVILGFVTIISDPAFLMEKIDSEYEESLYEKDKQLLIERAFEDYDSISNNLRAFMIENLIDQLKPEEHKILVKEQIDRKRVLVLIEFPKLKMLKKETKEEYREMLKVYYSNNEFFWGKEVYTGVLANGLMKIVDTPEKTVIGTLALTSDIFPFYTKPGAAKNL